MAAAEKAAALAAAERGAALAAAACPVYEGAMAPWDAAGGAPLRKPGEGLLQYQVTVNKLNGSVEVRFGGHEEDFRTSVFLEWDGAAVLAYAFCKDFDEPQVRLELRDGGARVTVDPGPHVTVAAEPAA